MPLAAPILDDVDFGQLVTMAVDKVKQQCPEWTDLSPGDPGMVLLELYAYLTEIMVYRYNQLPDKAYVEFLNLLGVSLRPPAAATAWLRFSATGALKAPIEIPRGTRVSATQATAGGETPVFMTARAITLTPAAPAAEVESYHCEVIDESAGFGTGRPGQRVAVRQPPIIAPTGDDRDLILGVELGAGEPPTDERSREFGGKTYRIWREVQNFAESDGDPYVYVADRMKGTIEFAPAVPAAEGSGLRVPAEGREIRIRYRRGGGLGGNVLADALKVLKDPIAGVEVTNPRAAAGGSAGETMAEALRRGPREFHSRGRAVTARDFEYIVGQRFGGAIARARAFTKRDLWQYAAPGTVEVLLVPNYLEMKERGERPITAQELIAQQNEQLRAKVQIELDKARPLGTTCLVNWTKYKTVSIKATIYAFPEEDEAQLRSRVSKRLYELINPLPTQSRLNGWPFGRPLRAFDVYEIIDREPGVASAGDVRLIVDDAPGKDVLAVVSDPFQKDTWYANAGSRVFRSNNRCDSWETVTEFPSANATRLSVSPEYVGMVAVCSAPLQGSAPVAVHVSRDCGETWTRVAQFEFAVEDICWSGRDGEPLLLLATAKGLYELAIVDDPIPQPIAVDPAAPETPLWSVAATTTDRGTPIVAVALQQNGGVMLREGANTNFVEWGLKNEDARVLEIQSYQKRRYLWAGVYARGLEGGGCHRRELELGVDQTWTPFTANWKGGSCRSMAFVGARIMAGTFRGGVLWLDSDRPDAQWQAPDLRCGLPVESEAKLFTQINAVATPPPMAKSKYSVVVCGPAGVFRATANLNAYESCSQVEFQETVNIPPSWLLCSGTHDLKVVVQGEDEGT